MSILISQMGTYFYNSKSHKNSSKSHKNRCPCLSLNGYLNPRSKLNSDKVDKSAYFQTLFDQSWTRAKIARNLIKIGGPWLSLKWVPKSTFKTQFWESWQKCIVSTLVWQTLNEGQNRFKYHKNRCPSVSIIRVSKSTLRFWFLESQQKCVFSTFVWPTLNEDLNSSKSHKNRCPRLSLKWVYIVSNFSI